MSNKINHLEDHTSEMGLVGCILAEPQILDKLLTKEPSPLSLFTHGDCANHMAVILSLYESDRLIDKITITRKFLEAGKANSLDFIDKCEDLIPSSSNWPYYLDILTGLRKKRQTKQLCDEVSHRIMTDGVAEPTGVLEELYESVEGLCKTGDRETSVKSYKDVLPEAVEFFQDCFERKGRIRGITTGLDNLDQMIMGLNKGDLNIVAARPSVGKTSLALCMADAAASAGKKVLFFSLEMKSSQILMRSICSEMEIDYREALQGDMSKEDLRKIQEGLSIMGKRPIYIDDNGTITIHNIKSKSKRMKRDLGIDLIIVDYLQIISSSKKFETRDREVANWSSQLKALAKDLDVPVVCLSQLSRDGARNERKPRLTDLRDSGAIEQDADVVIMMHRDYNIDMTQGRPYPLSLIVAKQRSGPVGEIEVEFVPKFTKLRTPSIMNHPDAPQNSFGHGS
tara:strand:+ start:6100 stop:7461 length:1362 start_codon:yes stop_codon:yes gene_type:complete